MIKREFYTDTVYELKKYSAVFLILPHCCENTVNGRRQMKDYAGFEPGAENVNAQKSHFRCNFLVVNTQKGKIGVFFSILFHFHKKTYTLKQYNHAGEKKGSRMKKK